MSLKQDRQRPPLRMLELFKGTGSVGNVFLARGYEVISLDNEARWSPDIHSDILDWNYKADLTPGSFDTIWTGVVLHTK